MGVGQHAMNANPNPELVREFLEAFEEVFDRDWSYTKANLGIGGPTEEQKRAITKMAEFGFKWVPNQPEGTTFINPGLDDEFEDWHNRGRLLVAYRALKKAVL